MKSTSHSNPQVKINPEYASLVSELSPEEYESLKQSIKEKGLYVPLIVNQDGIVLDGHHRFKACQELGIQNPNTVTKEFKDKLDEQLFVIDCNLKRRQLNNFQRTELALKSKSILAEIAKNHEKAGVKLDPSQDLVMGRQGVSGEIGKLAGVSHETVRKVEKILASESITDKVKQDLRLGKVSINEAYEKVELDQEDQSFRQKILKAYDEMEKSYAEIYNRPERTKEETERLRAQGKEKLWEETIKTFRNYSEKRLEFYKAYAAFYFWCEYRTYKNSDIESAASKTLKK